MTLFSSKTIDHGHRLLHLKLYERYLKNNIFADIEDYRKSVSLFWSNNQIGCLLLRRVNDSASFQSIPTFKFNRDEALNKLKFLRELTNNV